MTIGGISFTGDGLLSVGSATMLLLGFLYTRNKDNKATIETAATKAAVDSGEIHKIGVLEKTLNGHLLDCAKVNAELSSSVHGLRSDVSRLDAAVTRLVEKPYEGHS